VAIYGAVEGKCSGASCFPAAPAVAAAAWQLCPLETSPASSMSTIIFASLNDGNATSHFLYQGREKGVSEFVSTQGRLRKSEGTIQLPEPWPHHQLAVGPGTSSLSLSLCEMGKSEDDLSERILPGLMGQSQFTECKLCCVSRSPQPSRRCSKE
jgi:hypothetical protein